MTVELLQGPPAIEGPLMGVTNGSLLFGSDSKVKQDNANLFWDDTNKRFGVGTNVPLVPLHLVGTGTLLRLQRDSASGGAGFANFYNPNVTDGNAVVTSYLTDTSGVGAAAVVSLAEHAVTFETHDHGARAARFSWFTANGSAVVERMRLTPPGDLLIGTTTAFDAGVRLQVQGAASEKTAIFRANATSPGNVIEVQDSTTAGKAVVGATGQASFGTGSLSSTNFVAIAGIHPITTSAIRGFSSAFTVPSTATSSSALYTGAIITTAAAFTLAEANGYLVTPPSIGAGSTVTSLYAVHVNNQGATGVTDAYGMRIDAQSGAATLNIGARIDAATTQTLWISGNADNTTAAAGIAFGVSRDTNLYRLAANTLVTGSGSAQALFGINGAAGTGRNLSWYSGGVLRWVWQVTSTAESGSNVGSNLILLARDDSGAALFTPIQITRSTGNIGLVGTPASSTVAVLVVPNVASHGVMLGRGAASQTGDLLALQDSGATSYLRGVVRTDAGNEQTLWKIRTHASQSTRDLFQITDSGDSNTKFAIFAPTHNDDSASIRVGTTVGLKIGTATSQKLSLWNVAPDVQPTTGITAAAFVANTSGIADDSATFGGYTIGQVVAALKRIGALA